MYRFIFKDKEYQLNKENLEGIYNDENKPIKNLDLNKILSILNNNSHKIKFEKAYYDKPCEECLGHIKEQKKFYDFIEYYFYVYTKNNEFVISTDDKEYEGQTFNKLYKEGKVDSSYIVTISLCCNCSTYSIYIEELEV